MIILASAAGLVLMARTGTHSAGQLSSPPVAAAPAANDTDEELTAAVDRFLMTVAPGANRFLSLPTFARDKIEWAFGEVRAGRLRVVLLGDVDHTNLDKGTLMASGVVEGLKSIVIVRPRFIELLAEGTGPPQRPFTPEQINDFTLGLVHEVVHLQRRGAQGPDQVSRSEALDEEIRAWREVNLNVVRPFRADNQPMHAIFVEVDDAFRLCGDSPACRPMPLTTP